MRQRDSPFVAVRIAGHEAHGLVQFPVTGGSEDVRRFDPEGEG